MNQSARARVQSHALGLPVRPDRVRGEMRCHTGPANYVPGTAAGD